MNDMKRWMDSNHLMLNQLKTKYIEFTPSCSVGNKATSDLKLVNSEKLEPCTSVKNLGVLFDDKLLFDMHINKVVGICYSNTRNLGRIASKLSVPLKIQLVHSMILSHLDYCNALFYNMPSYLQKKLTKVLYAAVRFIFNLRGRSYKRCRYHMMPCLKKLHFLPIYFRICFKIALLTFKCLRGCAPMYLQNLIINKQPSSVYNFRDNDDRTLLQHVCTINTSKAESMFCFSSVKIWNALPKSVRECDKLNVFKSQLKSRYFNVALMRCLICKFCI